MQVLDLFGGLQQEDLEVAHDVGELEDRRVLDVDLRYPVDACTSGQ